MVTAFEISLISALGVCILLVVLFLGPTIGINDTLSSKAQTTDNASSVATSSAEHLGGAVENNKTASTFSAIGQISSLVITVPESGFNITNAFKVILTGEWNLNVNNGNITEFSVSFLASPMDGRKPHIHQITNFRPYDNAESIALTEDNSLSVNGTADIKINGILVWDKADVSISISKGNTFIFDPDDVDTQNHFGDQQVYGIVTRLVR